ncbi:DeoR/GlpR family DNA-binding transcription regulator [Fontivita pretiosa]|uniref:DeoR/GlpR family DNA-binding transcription regulator n=1 Tax=Fontivita pretiosa TaxID=2989684 RepID=UPI003D1634E7
MLIPERQSRLQEIIATRGMVDLETLAEELGVSQSTIRRDIDALAQRGLVTRTHGGVIWIGQRSPGGDGAGLRPPYAFDQRIDFQVEAKRKIARAARQLVSANDTILLDGGTTTYYFARELVGQRLQLVTNSLPIADLFLNDEQVELVVVGGLLYPRYGVLLGPTAEHVLETIHTKTLFFSVAGIHEGSLYNQNLLLVQSERRMMKQSQRVVLLADSSKFGQQALARLCDLNEIDTVVTDADLPEAHARRIRAAGCELILAR